jgi:adenylate cyclase
MPQSRQLAAIMFTDIVGYTALMGDDEQKAFELLRRNRQLQQPLIKQFNGTWIKEIGDGVLASFHTVTDAVLCASEIQKVCYDINDLKLRIGIHLGEVVFENNDVFGDGVNIASRLQALAPVGGIWISEPVYNNVANKKEIQTKFIRAEILKNVKEEVRIYEVITSNTEKEQQKSSVAEKSTGKTIPEKSIAVLPFINMSSDPEQEYFSDGMAEEIINSLTHIKDLKVAGRMSSFQFKGAKADLREVGEKLGVHTVLEGSVRKHGNKLRVTAQMINVEDGFHLWSEKFDRNMDDIFAIQDEIALAITEKLKITLLEKDREIITKTSTQNSEAYELYLKGRFYISRRGNFVLRGMEYFQKAISVDPSFALAYAGYADANMIASFYGFLPAKEVMEEIKQAAETAIKLDDSLCEPYCSLGCYYSIFERNWIEAKKNFSKGIELNPNYAQGHAWYGMCHLAWTEGKFHEAEKEGQIAVTLEPLSAILHANLSWILYTANKFEEALAFAKTGIELDANSFLSHRLAGLSYLSLKRYEEAIDTFKYLIIISNRHQHSLTGLIWAYCSNKNFEEARVLMNELKTRSATEYITGTYFGLSAAYLGDLDTAFNLLEKAYNDHDSNLTQLKYLSYVPASLKNDKRFQNLLDRIGFPE